MDNFSAPTTETNPIPTQHNHNKPMFYFVLVFLLLLVGLGGFVLGKFYTENNTEEPIDETLPLVQKLKTLPTTDPTANWETYKLEKLYSKTKVNFEIKYPLEYGEPQKKNEVITWVDKTNNKIIFSVSWLNPDMIYDVESICRANMCTKIDEVITSDQKYIIPIQKPTIERQTDLKLSNNYLFSEIFNSNKIYSLTFATDMLTASEFKTILSTFRFLDETSITSTENWKTYTNGKYGYEIKYPETWTMDEVNLDKKSLFPPEKYKIFAITFEPVQIDKNEFLNKYIQQFSIVKQDRYGINGERIIAHINSSSSSLFIIFLPDKVANVIITGPYTKDTNINTEIDHILSTFKSIE